MTVWRLFHFTSNRLYSIFIEYNVNMFKTNSLRWQNYIYFMLVTLVCLSLLLNCMKQTQIISRIRFSFNELHWNRISNQQTWVLQIYFTRLIGSLYFSFFFFTLSILLLTERQHSTLFKSDIILWLFDMTAIKESKNKYKSFIGKQSLNPWL